MKSKLGLFTCCMMAALSSQVFAGDGVTAKAHVNEAKSRLTIGGYGEATVTRNFYSDNVFRYQTPEKYKNDKGHTQFDLPHVVLMLGYDFGKGWSMGTEIEFEHGGTEAAVEMEPEEAGEFEKEIERGGEVALEQFWIQKSFSPYLNLKFGHLVLPVGRLNAHHLPTQFFTVMRSEGEFSIFPSTWHATGVSVSGKAGKWSYEAMLVPSLNSNLFTNANFVQGGAASPFEFTPGNKLGTAFRLDNTSIKGLRIGISGFYGETFNNSNQTSKGTYAHIHGALGIGSIDFDYKGHNWIVRGNADIAQLGDAKVISDYNIRANVGKLTPYKNTAVGKQAYAVAIEAGYNVFSQIRSRRKAGEELYLFGRYDKYDSYVPADGNVDLKWTNRQKWTVGLNYYPIRQIVVKAEYAQRLFEAGYNNEPSFSLGIAYAGFFTR